LVEYKNEAFDMFNELRERIQASIVARIFRVHVQPNPAAQPPPPVVRRVLESGPGDPDGAGGARGNGAPKTRTAQREGARAGAGAAGPAAAGKIGRNDPCWCGSGKKFKRCHGR
jgi:preprotein translocase subunit SecA